MNERIKVEIKGEEMIITLPISQPHPSKSGKTIVIASTQGNIRTSEMFEGKPITIGVNAYISK